MAIEDDIRNYINDLTTARSPFVSGPGSSTPVIGETPAGTVDGSNRVFTLAHSTVLVVTLVLTVNSALQTQGVTYSILNGVITFITPPPVSAVILASYSYA